MSHQKKRRKKSPQKTIIYPTKSCSSFQKNALSLKPLPKGFLVLQEKPLLLATALVINFFAGLGILYFTNTLLHFILHLLSLTANMTITIAIGREYVDTIIFLDKKIVMEYTSENVELRMHYLKFREKTFSKSNLILCLIILIVFFWGIFSQNYIVLDVVGCYAVFIVSVTVSISVIGYSAYLYLLWFLYRIRNCTQMHYNTNNPASTPFLVKIATLTNHAKWCFLSEGFLYVFEYYILIPKENITPEGLQMPDNTSFLITWLVVFVVIILAFPIIVFLQESLMAQIVNNLKLNRINVLSELYENQISCVPKSFPVEETFMLNTIISNIISSADYPVKIQRFGPALISLATFFLHAVTLLSQLPSLKYLFQSIGS